MVDTPEAAGVDTSFGYDLRGRVLSKVRNFGASGAYAFSYVYDAMGRRVFANLPNGKAIRHFYDGSVLEEIKIGPPNPGTSIAGDVLLHPSGAIAEIDYFTIGGGSSYTYEPDTHRLATATSWDAGGTLQDLAFGYDLAGNLTSTTDALGDLSQAFTYDGLHRLATATGTGTSGYGALGYGFDAAGNLTSKGPVGSPLLLSYAGGNAGPHGVTGVSGPETGSFGYDGDGQVTARTRGAEAQSITRDDDGRIESVVGVAGYVYDETGERARKTGTAAGDTLYVDREYEVDLVGATHEIHYFHGSRRAATETRSGLGLPGGGGSGSLLSRQFYFPDFVGSNAVVAKNDGTLQKSFFRPFGEFAQEGGGMTPYLFTDQEHDPETGLQYFGARYYDPWVGRFMGPDPALIGPSPGVTFNRVAGDAQNLNAYSYALNRPTIMVDANGEAAWRVGVAVGRVILNGGRVGLEVKGIVDDVRTVTNSNASTGDRVLAGISLATGIPGGWLKSVFKVADKGSDAKSTAKAATGTSNATEGGTVTRYMGSGEAKVARETGQIPNTGVDGNPRPTHVTTDAPTDSASGARDRYELDTTPTHRATVPESRVQDLGPAPDGKPTTSGGGSQAATDKPIPVKPDEIRPLNK